MEKKIDANDALQVLVHMLADNLATTRTLQDIFVTHITKDAPHLESALTQKLTKAIEERRQAILDAIWAAHGSLDWNDLFGNKPKD